MDKQIIDKLAWIDLEMTGLDPINDRIVEIAIILTDTDLKIVDQMDSIVVSCEQKFLDNMNQTVLDMHTKSGLLEKTKDSDISLKKAEEMSLDFLKKHVKKNQAPLCGSTISQDRAFINIYMKKLADYLHYRVIDVTSIKQLFHLWQPDSPSFEKNDTHRALDDIQESIEELRYYKERFFKIEK